MKAFGGKPVVRICHDIEKREKKVACFVDRRALVAFRDYNIYNIIEFNWIRYDISTWHNYISISFSESVPLRQLPSRSMTIQIEENEVSP